MGRGLSQRRRATNLINARVVRELWRGGPCFFSSRPRACDGRRRFFFSRSSQSPQTKQDRLGLKVLAPGAIKPDAPDRLPRSLRNILAAKVCVCGRSEEKRQAIRVFASRRSTRAPQTPKKNTGRGGAAEEEAGDGGGKGLVEFTDPFLICVHHRHSFHAWDPFRALQAKFFPEGAS